MKTTYKTLMVCIVLGYLSNQSSFATDTVYVGTQGGTGKGHVYKYRGNIDPQNPANNWTDLTPSIPSWNVASVMSMAVYQGKLYVGVQTAHGTGGGGGQGHVW